MSEELAYRIRQLRLEAHMSKAGLARAVGVSDVTVSYWESGKINEIGHNRLVRLCATFGISLNALLGMAHWTDAHIKKVEDGFAALDMQGEVLTVRRTLDEARDYLVSERALSQFR